MMKNDTIHHRSQNTHFLCFKFVIFFSCKQSIFRTITSHTFYFDHDIGISSKCHMIGSKSRALF